MGKSERKLKRRHSSGSKASITLQALSEFQKLPEHLEEVIKANQVLTDENARIMTTLGIILEEHANKISALEKRLNALELSLKSSTDALLSESKES